MTEQEKKNTLVEQWGIVPLYSEQYLAKVQEIEGQAYAVVCSACLESVEFHHRKIAALGFLPNTPEQIVRELTQWKWKLTEKGPCCLDCVRELRKEQKQREEDDGSSE